MTQIQRSPNLKRRVVELEQERSQTQRALDALHRIGLVCRGQHNPYSLLEAIYHELKTIWEFDACFMALCDQTDASHYRLAMLVDEGVIEFGDHDPVGPITGYMIKHRTPLLFNDLTIERTQIGLEKIETFGTEKLSRAWMGVPLLIGAEAFGVVSLQSYRVGVFSPQDLDLLGRVTSSMAIALENALLAHRQSELTHSLEQQVSRRNADLFVISDIAAMLTQQQPLPEMFGSALDFILYLMQLDAGGVFAYEHGMLQLIAQRGASDLLVSAKFAPNDLVRQAFEQREFQIVAIPPTDPTTLVSGFEHLASQIVQPLYSEDHVIGVLVIGTLKTRPILIEEVELLQVVSNQLALALEHGNILAQQQRHIAELEALSDISSVIIRSLEPDTLLRQIEQALRTFLEVDVFYMAIYDPERNVTTVSLAIEGGSDPVYIRRDTPPRGGSFTEWVINHRQPLLLQHVSNDIVNYPSIKRAVAKGHPSETWLGVPMLDSDNQPLGLISLQSYRPYAFDERDLRFMQSVASHISLHILNVQLFQQRERQLQELNALQRISALVTSTLDVPSMMRGLSEILCSFMKIDSFLVVLCSPDQMIDDIFVAECNEETDYRWMIGQPMPSNTTSTWVMKEQKPLRINDLDHDSPDLRPLRLLPQGGRSWVGVPIFTQTESVLGVLSIQHLQPNMFSQRDELFLLQVAQQFSLALHNARLFAQRERQLAELDAQHRITQLVSSTLDLDQMLHSVDAVLRDFLKADAFQVLICDNQRNVIETVLVLERGTMVQTNVVGQPIPPHTLVAWTYNHGQPLRLGNIFSDWQTLDGVSKPPAHAAGMDSWLSVPLFDSTTTIGVLAVRAVRQKAFNPRHEQFLLNVGRQLTLSIRNARLFAAEQQARRTADTLREISRVLNTTLNPDEMLDLILRELKKVIPYDSASVMLPFNTTLRIMARQAERDQDTNWRNLSFPIDNKNGAGRVILSREPLVINDTLQDSAWTPSPMKYVVRSWIGVPLINKGEVLGVLNINSLEPYAFTEQSVDIAQTFANHAATALEHARLYQESVTRVEQELDIARRIQSNLFPQTLPAIAGVQVAALCIPARETGGDFYDIVELHDECWGFIVGDASGKSIPGAMLMAIARSITRSEARDHETPQLVMRETNRWICRDVPAHTFVALSYATFDARTHGLALANAGQLDPIVVSNNGQLRYLETPGAHFPLGINPNTAYQTATFQLHPNDVVVFYTDGVVEAKSSSGEMWGFERLEHALQVHAPNAEPTHLIATLMDHINAFTNHHPQHDDMTLVVLKIDRR